MRIAVYTLTRERLYYTKIAFESLKARSGVDYDHYIFDNGSQDETPNWLTENRSEFRWVHCSPTNVGISAASNACLDAIFANGPYDLVCKFDNDALVLSDDLLKRIATLYEEWALWDSHVLSPAVAGIRRQPQRAHTKRVGGFTLGRVPIVGGLFHIVPGKIYEQYRYPALNLARGQDDDFCEWARQKHLQVCYVEELYVEHQETTDGQAQRYPEYFKRKWEEEKTPA